MGVVGDGILPVEAVPADCRVVLRLGRVYRLPRAGHAEEDVEQLLRVACFRVRDADVREQHGEVPPVPLCQAARIRRVYQGDNSRGVEQGLAVRYGPDILGTVID